MNSTNFIALLNAPESISSNSVSELEEVVKKHPYFQSAHAILLKGFKQNNNYKYNKALKVTAATTIDRSVLFEYISDFKFPEEASDPEEKTNLKTTSTETNSKNLTEETLQIGTPLEFSKKEGYSFNEWLQLTNKKPIVRKTKSNSNLSNKLDIIDRFIDENPTIKPISKENHNHFQKENNYNENELMTETLAKVYLEQKKYSNAIKAYDILILKYPEKSGFFADQIKKIEHLKNK